MDKDTPKKIKSFRTKASAGEYDPALYKEITRELTKELRELSQIKNSILHIVREDSATTEEACKTNGGVV